VKFRLASVLTAALLSAGLAHANTELVIATVNNGHMIEMQKLGHHFESANPGIKLKWVTLEEGVFCGPSMVFTNVHNPRALIERKDQYRDTLVRRGATLGANCTVVCGVTIGKFAFVAAGAVVTRDVPDFALIAGVPGRQIGWMSAYGERLDLPLQGTATDTCPHTGDTYTLASGAVTRKEAKA
jgi:UDP-2-acetamido-3-amino-2,3-dideoxy-glucuronate N-acetyltransferase